MAKKAHSRKSIQQDSSKADINKIKNEDIIDKKTEDKFEVNFKNKKFIASLPFIIAAILYSLIWIVPIGSPVVDPWYAAVKLVDSSNKVDDQIIKTKLLEEGGNELLRLVKIHPYHARVHFFAGYYYFIKHEWDSSLKELQTAAQMDSGATINAIWPNAHDLIVKASLNKCNIYLKNKDLIKAKETLSEAYKFTPNNPMLNKYLGSICFDMKDYQSAQKYFMISMTYNPKDHETANFIGILYKMQGDINNASAYFRKSLELKPDFQQAKVNLASLKQ